MANVGEKAQFIIRDSNGREFTCEGIVYGRVTDRGGKKYLIKSWNIISPDTIGVRKLIDKANEANS